MLPNPPARPRTRPSPPPASSPPPPLASPPATGPASAPSCAEAGEVADPHRRYEARRALLELAPEQGRRTPRSWLAAAAAAVDMLQADPREPVLLNYAGVIFYELGAVKAAQALFAAAQRLDPELPNVERNLAECARRKRAGVRVLPAGRRARPRAAAARRPHRRRRAPGRGPDHQPVHDRQGRGGDDRALPAGRARRRRRDHRRRHRVDRPHRRDRREPRRPRPAPRVGRRLLRRAQRRPSTPPPATGSCTSTPTRCSWPTTSQRLRALAGPHLARGLLPDRDQPHRRPRGRHGDHARRHAPVPQPPRVPLRGPHPRADRPVPAGLPARAPGAHHRARRALRLPGRGPRHQGQVQPQPRAARAPGGRGRRQPLPALQPRLGVRRRRRRRPRADALRARLDHRARRRAREQRRLRAGAGLALRPRAAQRRPPGRRRHGGRRGPRDLPRLHRHRPRAGARRRRRRRRRAPGGAAAPLPGDGRRAQPLLGDRRLRHLPPARGPGRGPAPPRRRRGGRGDAARLPARAPRLPGRRRPLRRRAAAPRRPGRRGRRDGPRPRGRLEPEHALPARRRAQRGRRRRRGRGRAARRRSRPSRPTPTPASRWPRRCWPRAASPTPPPRPPSVDPEAPCAAAAAADRALRPADRRRPRPTPGAAVALPDEERAVFAAWEAVRSGAGAPAALPAAGRGARAHHARRPGAPAGLRRLRGPRGRARGRRHARGASAVEALAELYLRHGYADSAAEEWIAACEQGGVDAPALRGLAAVAVARGLDEDAQVFAAEAEALAAA